jgi:hypothetical protein
VREETGLDAEPVALAGVYKNMNLGVVNLVFRCTVLGGRLTENDEVIAFRWASEADTRELAVPAHAARVLDALRADESPAVRQHAPALSAAPRVSQTRPGGRRWPPRP